MAKDLQDINDGDLIEALNDSKEELFNLRFQLVTGQLDNFSRIKEVKKEVDEGVLQIVKTIGRAGRPKTTVKKAEKATDAGARARRKLQQKDHETVNFLPMEEEKDAYKYVVSKLKKQYGDGVLTKGDKIKPPTAAQKKEADAHRAKRAKQDHRDPTEKASDVRYSDRYSNRGSD